MLLFIYLLLILAAGAGIVAIALKVVETISTKSGKELKTVTRERDVAVSRVRTAEHGLREIANGISGNPALTAQVTLDDMSNVKEIA